MQGNNTELLELAELAGRVNALLGHIDYMTKTKEQSLFYGDDIKAFFAVGKYGICKCGHVADEIRQEVREADIEWRKADRHILPD